MIICMLGPSIKNVGQILTQPEHVFISTQHQPAVITGDSIEPYWEVHVSEIGADLLVDRPEHEGSCSQQART